MSKGMTFQEFGHLLKYIRDCNSPMRVQYPKPSITYVDPVIDMRSCTVFAVTFRGSGFNETVFHTQNECSNLPESLEERIRAFLNAPAEHTLTDCK